LKGVPFNSTLTISPSLPPCTANRRPGPPVNSANCLKYQNLRLGCSQNMCA
jgi:hypothetical protein